MGLVQIKTETGKEVPIISSSFQLGQQEDAHEFLQCLLDRLHTCCLTPRSNDNTSSLEDDSIVNQVFGGRLRSQLRCCECGHSSNKFEAMLDISLEIDNAENLIDALESFTKAEKLEDVKFTCDGCKAQVTMEKQMKLERAPAVIALQLKRFKKDDFVDDKIRKFIEYPMELDFKPFLSCPADEEQTKYDHYAVLVHHGSSYYGHYFCTVRSTQFTWIEMNDSQVSSVSETAVVGQMAYVLFYGKQGSSPWFSTFLESVKIPDMITFSKELPISVHDWTSGGSRLSSARDKASRNSSSSSASPERNGDPTPLKSPTRSPQSTPALIERGHYASTPLSASNDVCKDTKDRSKTQSNRLYCTSADNLNYKNFEFFEEETRNNFVLLRASKPDLEETRGPPVKSSVGRLLRGMTNSRWAGLMACLPSPQLNKQPIGKKRKRPWEVPVKPLAKNLSPCFVKRG